MDRMDGFQGSTTQQDAAIEQARRPLSHLGCPANPLQSPLGVPEFVAARGLCCAHRQTLWADE